MRITDRLRLDWLLTPGSRGMACIRRLSAMEQVFRRSEIDAAMNTERKSEHGKAGR